MYNNTYSRHLLLKVIGLALVSLALASCRPLHTTASQPGTVTFVQMCDPQLGTAGYEHDVQTFKAAVKQINALKPDFVVICGDLVHTASDSSFSDFNAIKADFKVPCYCVPGNHDVENVPTQASLNQYRQAMGQDYSTFNYKGYCFVLVNTQLWKAPFEGESEKQDTWLEQTLKNAANKKLPVFVIGHYPQFLKEPYEADASMNLPLSNRQELLPLFKETGVVAVLAGHTHQLIINEHMDIQWVNGETTSKNNDKRPLGFRVWHIEGDQPFKHEFVPLEESTSSP